MKVNYYKAERATTPVLLAMQGVDHAQAREDLPMVLNVANDTIDDIEFVHASLEDFRAALQEAVADVELKTVYGELRDVPRSAEGMNFLLYNVLSSRIDNKLQNAQTLIALENWAEPWCALAWSQGVAEYPQGHLWTAWRWLLKNHPHDSIGGCSVDEVHRQMATRFEWATEIADGLAEERFRLLAEELDLSAADEDEIALVLFNSTPWERDEVITVDIDLPEYWLRQRALAGMQPPSPATPDSPYRDTLPQRIRADWMRGMPDLPEVFFRGIHVRPADGEPVPVQIESLAEMPVALAMASGPHGIMDVRRVRASFHARIPAYGYTTYMVKTDPKPAKWPAPNVSHHEMENEYLNISVNPNGTFNLSYIESGVTKYFQNLGLFEDSGDNGDGYTFSPPPFNRIYSTQSASPRIAKVGRGVGVQRMRLEYDFELPVSLNDARSERRQEIVVCPLQVDLILRDGSKRLEIEITFDNRAKDHQLRMLFPTGLTGVNEASSAMQFDVVTRPIKPEPIQPGDWWVEDPPETFPMHGWMNMSGNGRGLCIIAQGVHEFAVEDTDEREIALTLLRAVGCLGAGRDSTTIDGGAGPAFQTPEAQLQQTLKYRLALYPHSKTWHEDEVWRQSAEFMTPPRAITVEPHTGTRPAQASWLRVDGENAVLSSVKRSEDGEALIVRLFNPTQATTTAAIELPVTSDVAHLVDLEENTLQEITLNKDETMAVELPPRKIVTVRIIVSNSWEDKLDFDIRATREIPTESERIFR